MNAFWKLARRLLRYKAALAGAIALSFFSAGSLGTGLVAAEPVLRNILRPEVADDLPVLVGRLNARIGGIIPEAWIDALPAGPSNAVFWIVIALGLLTLLSGTATFLHAYLSLTIVQRTTARIRHDVFHRVIKLPLKDVVRSGSADMISRIVGDTGTLEAGFSALLSKAMGQATKGTAAFVAALIIEWRLTLVSIPVALLLGVVIRRLGKRIRRASKKALASTALLYSAANEAMQGLRVVKVHGAERYESGRFHRINKDVMGQMMKVRTARALASPLVEVLSILVLGMLSVIAANQIIQGVMEAERVLLALAALFAAGASLKPLSGLVADIQVSAAAADRLVELLGRPLEPGHGHRLPALPRHAESIEFDRITFTYPGSSEPALRGISLTIRHGERVAFVGPNGSGKTTLLGLVPRLFDPDVGGGDHSETWGHGEEKRGGKGGGGVGGGVGDGVGGGGGDGARAMDGGEKDGEKDGDTASTRSDDGAERGQASHPSDPSRSPSLAVSESSAVDPSKSPSLAVSSSGRILIDGHDIRDFSIRSLRRQIGVVPQETVLFRGTIRSNIIYGFGSATDEQVRAAARKARAEEFILAAPHGYDTVVGEQGLTLSGGQRQRLAIARAILRDPAILILDEATSMIDADSESRIAEAITDFAAGRTCLIVAHRLSTVLTSDRIVVLDAGRVVDQGSHAELMQRCEIYRTIARTQLFGE